MVNITEEMRDDILYTNIALTRGDDVELEMPIYTVSANGTKTEYSPTENDSFLIQVRNNPVTGIDNVPTVVFTGTISRSTVGSRVRIHWAISHIDSTQECKRYYWDCQMTSSNKVYTIYQGYLTILPESSIAGG